MIPKQPVILQMYLLQQFPMVKKVKQTNKQKQYGILNLNSITNIQITENQTNLKSEGI